MNGKQLVYSFLKMAFRVQKKIKIRRDKDKFLEVLMKNNGHHSVLDLGAQIGLDENDTMEIVAQLLSEFKIEYTVNGFCDYSLMRTQKRGKKSN